MYESSIGGFQTSSMSGDIHSDEFPAQQFLEIILVFEKSLH
ncbi:hypothetical protein HMPREF3193_00238 [Bifidobacterium breve]|nr:hypothetical protein HMPREF1587_01224 [Bifidobacterium breve JCP7499]KWZ86533.1 hypothetical protein HMPREF3193_00238 [Bifidobacterium breve]